MHARVLAKFKINIKFKIRITENQINACKITKFKLNHLITLKNYYMNSFIIH